MCVRAYSFGAVEHSWAARQPRRAGRSLKEQTKKDQIYHMLHFQILKQYLMYYFTYITHRQAYRVPSISFRSHQAWTTLHRHTPQQQQYGNFDWI